MAKHSLILHSASPSGNVQSVDVEVARGDYHETIMHFSAKSDGLTITIPPPVRYASRCDGLWKTTCFELFIRKTVGEGYFEFNFSPSTAWAAYSFTDYRDRMSLVEIDPPHFDVDIDRNELVVTIVVDTASLHDLDANADWLIALSAVIEETDGTKSYWALNHPPGKPDFHHPDCFVLTLPATEAA